jgi:tRNA G10  N-methylase Trm11
MLRSNVLQPSLDLKLISLADVHTAKRGERERAGVHAWHPYYAGYAEQFVADTLSVLAKPGDLVLDPWNGSGTTTLVAQRCGLRSVGIELNAAMALYGHAKNLQFPQESDAIVIEAEDLIEAARLLVNKEPAESEDIAEWVHDEPLAALLAIRNAIRNRIADAPLPDFVDAIVRKEARKRLHPSRKKAFFLSALFQVLRTVGSFTRGSNPTWILPDDGTPPASTDRVFGLFLQAVRSMLADLEVSAWGTESIAGYWVMTGDSRALPLTGETVDVVVTSPPYCTRIDYAVSTKPELLLLGYSNGELDTLRRDTMGAPVIVDKSIVQQDIWGKTCNDFIDAVAKHPSKASKSYYWPNYLQYFRDAEQSLREIGRVLKKSGHAAIVVQSSYYKDIELPLGQIYVEMAKQLGFGAEIARRETVRQHMAHVNTQSRQYVKDKVYYEDVALLHK